MQTKLVPVILYTMLVVLPSFAMEEKPLSLSEAARIMMENNPGLSQKSLESQKAGKGVQAATASYFPRFDFTQNWSRSNNPVYVFGSLLNQRQFAESNFNVNSLNDPAALTDISSRFDLSWLLYDFGRREYRMSSAKEEKQIAVLQQQAAANRYLQELVRRYYAVSLASSRIHAAEDALASALARKDDAAERVEQGMSVQTDLLSAEVHLALMQQEKIDAANQYSLSIAALNELLGNAEHQKLVTAPLEDKNISVDELPILMSQMKENIPDLKIVSDQKTLAESRKNMVRSDFLPELQAWSSYEWHGKSYDYTGDNWGAGFQLKWNLFDGFSDAAALASAKLDSQIASERQRELENALLLQLKSSYFQFQSAIEKRKVAAAVLTHARENRRIFADRYGEGLATMQSSLQAESEYSTSQLTYLQNLYNVYTSYADLLAAAGRIQDIFSLETGSQASINQFEEGAK